MKKKSLKLALKKEREARAEAETKIQNMRKRFAVLMSDKHVLTLQDERVKELRVEGIKPLAFGTYAEVFDKPNKANRDRVVHMLAESLAEEMIKQQFAQVIEHYGDIDPFGKNTIAVKMFLVPWEQMAKLNIP